MAKIYARQILGGKITIDDVPSKWRQAVMDILEGDG